MRVQLPAGEYRVRLDGNMQWAWGWDGASAACGMSFRMALGGLASTFPAYGDGRASTVVNDELSQDWFQFGGPGGGNSGRASVVDSYTGSCQGGTVFANGSSSVAGFGSADSSGIFLSVGLAGNGSLIGGPCFVSQIYGRSSATMGATFVLPQAIDTIFITASGGGGAPPVFPDGTVPAPPGGCEWQPTFLFSNVPSGGWYAVPSGGSEIRFDARDTTRFTAISDFPEGQTWVKVAGTSHGPFTRGQAFSFAGFPDGSVSSFSVRPSTGSFTGTTSFQLALNAPTGSFAAKAVGPSDVRVDLERLSQGLPPNMESPQFVTRGETVRFAARVTGNCANTYQWRRNSVAIPGETGPTLTLTDLTPEQCGAFSVVVQNELGTAESPPLSIQQLLYSLTVNAPGGTVERTPDQAGYEPGTAVTLQALTQPGQFFAGWGGDVHSTANPLAITLNQNTTATAWFGSPFGGTPRNVPGLIEAEDFDEGGEGVAYHDVEVENFGGSLYRTGGVDVLDGPTGRRIGWNADGEWRHYTVNVTAAGWYRAVLRVSSGASGGTAQLRFSGGQMTEPIAVPGTGAWDAMVSVASGPFALPAGIQVVQLDIVQAGFDVDSFELVPVQSTPFGGIPWPVPGVIQAEDFDEGGEGSAYHDADAANQGGSLYRSEGVDIVSWAGGERIGWTANGEWLHYTINVPAAGSYRAVLRLSGDGVIGTARLRFSGGQQSELILVGGNGSWDAMVERVSEPFVLPAGVQVMQLDIVQAGFDLDSIEFLLVQPANTAPIVANPIASQNATYGTVFSFTVPANTFSDADAGQTLSYNASGLPAWLAFDSATRTFSGTPPALGSANITITATDNGSPALSASTTFDLVVGKSELTATGDTLYRFYGQENPPLTGTLVGVVNGDNITASYSTTATPAGPAGVYTINVALNDPDNRLGNYNVTKNTGALYVQRAPQTITFGAIPPHVYGDAPFTVPVSASSGLPVTLTSLTPSVATVSENTVAIVAAGTATIRASQVGDANYQAAPNMDQSFGVNKATPVITWAAPESIISGTPLSQTQLNAAASYNGETVPGAFDYSPPLGSILNIGTHTLSVTFAPDDTDSFLPATASVIINVLGPSRSVTFDDVGHGWYRWSGLHTAGNSNFGAQAGLYRNFFSFDLSSLDLSGKVLESATLVIHEPGPICETCVSESPLDTDVEYELFDVDFSPTTLLQGRQIGDQEGIAIYGDLGTGQSYAKITHRTHLPDASLLEIPLNADAIANINLSAGGSFSIGGTVLTANAILFGNSGDPALVHELVLVLRCTGDCAEPQTISFDSPDNRTYGDPPFTINATASSGLPVTFTSLTPSVATVSGNTVTIIGPGLATIRASQGGDVNFLAAADMDRTFTVGKAALTVTADSFTRLYLEPNPTLTGTLTGVANGDNITANYTTAATTSSPGGVYTIFVTLNDPDNRLGNYTVTTVNGSLRINAIAQAITFDPIPAHTYGDAPFTLSISTSSGLPLTINSLSPSVATVSGNTVTILSAGTATIVAYQFGDGSYQAATPLARTLTVSKATPGIMWALPADINCHTVLGATHLNAIANAPGTFAYDPPPGTTLGVGDAQMLSANFTPADTANWNPATVTTTINVRLHPGAPLGQLDSSFDATSGTSGFQVRMIAVQPDGKSVICGWFTSVQGVSRNEIARLNADGSLDLSFDPGSGAGGGGIDTVTLQPDGKVLVSGDFTTINGVNRRGVARLHQDGSVDASFNPGTGANSRVLSVAVQTDGKVLIGGFFASVNGVSRNRIARLNSDGSVDTSFDPGAGVGDGYVWRVAAQADGKVLLVGSFTTVNGVSRNRIARLQPDGSLDAGFDVGTGANQDVYAVAVQSDGKLVVGGSFTSVNGLSRSRLARLNEDGSLDPGFSPNVAGPVWSVVTQPDGRILIGGNMGSVNGVNRMRVARLLADGTVDPSFDPLAGPDNQVRALALQPDGKLLVGGDFASVNGVERKLIARLEAGPDAPTVALNGSAALTHEYNTPFIDPGGTAFDACGSELPVSVTGGVNVLAAGTYTLTYSATDAAGQSSSETRNVSVVITDHPPVAAAGADQRVLAGTDCLATVTVDGSASSDADNDALSYSWKLLHEGAVVDSAVGDAVVAWSLPIGSYEAVLTVTTDKNDNLVSRSDSLLIQVVASAPALAAMTPAGAYANGPAFNLTVSGGCFLSGAVVHWNGSPRPTTVVNSSELVAAIPASDLQTGVDIAVATVHVVNGDGQLSNPLGFSIVAQTVGTADAAVLQPGETTTVSTAPAAVGEPGVTVTVQNSGDQAVSVLAASYDERPVGDTAFQVDNGSFVDVQIAGADENVSATVFFYYPSTTTGGMENRVKLRYFDGANWIPVLSSGGLPPAKDTTDNLDGTVSGGRFAVIFDMTSTPKVTELTGTVFGMFESLPQLGAITGPTGPVALGNPVTVAASFATVGDPAGVAVQFLWGDGTETVVNPSVAGSASPTHLYAAPGVYGVTVQVMDAQGDVREGRFEFVVIYDPNGGFVTGGGWIDSPAGDYVFDPTLAGKATFGFNSRYQKGKTVPTGETQFQFQAGDFKFHSTAYEWLVVSGAKAQYKGVGQVNGAGNYGFLLTATDGQLTGGGGVDKFRIKVWDRSSGTLVYDNVLGASDDMDGANPQALGGGSIVVQKGK